MKQVSGQSRWHTVFMVFKSGSLLIVNPYGSAALITIQEPAVDGNQPCEYEGHAAEGIPAGTLSQYHDSKKNGHFWIGTRFREDLA
jgi:hypothetical protein